ncbi:hypothetical protein BCR34DRAFT_588243 [Clohesyomyces aquaticus]|uniref:Uncharacterized protein n=1 Tax=Clohesyomyces aquaticus TaxID=1231657 RepID=A0A1Y1ZL77_9PLEO|nr:hypothetical protein BCR34DRAFT_588243 [Clohesyomyces aquaticus]
MGRNPTTKKRSKRKAPSVQPSEKLSSDDQHAVTAHIDAIQEAWMIPDTSVVIPDGFAPIGVAQDTYDWPLDVLSGLSALAQEFPTWQIGTLVPELLKDMSLKKIGKHKWWKPRVKSVDVETVREHLREEAETEENQGQDERGEQLRQDAPEGKMTLVDAFMDLGNGEKDQGQDVPGEQGHSETRRPGERATRKIHRRLAAARRSLSGPRLNPENGARTPSGTKRSRDGDDDESDSGGSEGSHASKRRRSNSPSSRPKAIPAKAKGSARVLPKLKYRNITLSNADVEAHKIQESPDVYRDAAGQISGVDPDGGISLFGSNDSRDREALATIAAAEAFSASQRCPQAPRHPFNDTELASPSQRRPPAPRRHRNDTELGSVQAIRKGKNKRSDIPDDGIGLSAISSAIHHEEITHQRITQIRTANGLQNQNQAEIVHHLTADER